MGNRSDIDWELIEREYRLGVKTNVQVASDNDVSRPSMLRRAKKEGWTKNLSAQVQLETKARVSAAIVKEATAKVQQSYIADASAVQIESISNALMIAEHEKSGTTGRKAMDGILQQIADQVANPVAVADLLKAVLAADPIAGVLLSKTMSLATYADTAKKAIEGITKSIEIERKARNMDNEKPQDDERTRLLRQIVEEAEAADDKPVSAG